MHNAVVAAIARAMAARGMVALRFNFRGSGGSGGRYDHGRGEQADVAGALDWLLAQPWVDPYRLVLAGYSFGAWVGLAHAQSEPRIRATAAVGLVPWSYEADLTRLGAGSPKKIEDWGLDTHLMQLDTRPKLFVSGAYDAFAPPSALRHMVNQLPPPKILRILPGTDHFFQGREQEIGHLVAEFLAGL
jgi:alpha/beta superfamily hydrolase